MDNVKSVRANLLKTIDTINAGHYPPPKVPPIDLLPFEIASINKPFQNPRDQSAVQNKLFDQPSLSSPCRRETVPYSFTTSSQSQSSSSITSITSSGSTPQAIMFPSLPDRRQSSILYPHEAPPVTGDTVCKEEARKEARNNSTQLTGTKLSTETEQVMQTADLFRNKNETHNVVSTNPLPHNIRIKFRIYKN